MRGYTKPFFRCSDVLVPEEECALFGLVVSGLVVSFPTAPD